jgi:Uma2 family endonuclease
MSTVVKIGPTDHGRPMTYDEFMAGDYELGYKYELIDGELYVSPEANLPENWVEVWLCEQLSRYSRKHPEVINYVSPKARIFVSARRKITCPEPDMAAYHNFPRRRRLRDLRWEDVSPIVVGEVLHEGDPVKDLERNTELFLQVHSIKEYWVIDMRADPDHPTMLVHRRQGKQWRIIEVAAGETYRTRFLPGFKLLLDPRS